MRRRQRKLLGVIATLAFVIVYALVAMALAQARFVQGAPGVLQWVYYGVVGMAWVLPLMPLIRWMEKPDPAPRSPPRSNDDAPAPVPERERHA